MTKYAESSTRSILHGKKRNCPRLEALEGHSRSIQVMTLVVFGLLLFLTCLFDEGELMWGQHVGLSMALSTKEHDQPPGTHEGALKDDTGPKFRTPAKPGIWKVSSHTLCIGFEYPSISDRSSGRIRFLARDNGRVPRISLGLRSSIPRYHGSPRRFLPEIVSVSRPCSVRHPVRVEHHVDRERWGACCTNLRRHRPRIWMGSRR